MKKRTSLLKGFVTCCVLCAIMVSTLGCSKEEPKGEPIEESVVNVEEPEIVVTGDRKITPLNIDINLMTLKIVCLMLLLKKRMYMSMMMGRW